MYSTVHVVFVAPFSSEAKDNQGKEIYQELLEKCAADMFIMSSRLEPDEDQGRGLGEVRVSCLLGVNVDKCI